MEFHPTSSIKISKDRLIFIMGIPIPGNTVFILRRGPDLEESRHDLVLKVELILCFVRLIVCNPVMNIWSKTLYKVMKYQLEILTSD